MKIGFVLDDSLDKSDGVQQYVLTLGGWLSEQGHDVHYLVGQTGRDDIKNLHSLSRNLNVSFNKNRMSTPLPANRNKVRQLLERERFDVLHVQLPYSPMLAGRIISAAPDVTAIIGTFHIVPASGIEAMATKALGVFSRPTLKRFDDVLSVSQPAALVAKTAFGLESSILPNVVDSSLLKAGAATGRSDGAIKIVFLGRLVERKGCIYLLKALAVLKKRGGLKNVKVYICGSGPLEGYLRGYVKKNGLDDNVRFMGYISEQEKANRLSAANIAVFPSTGGESFGIVLIEAMAAGAEVVIGGDNVGYRSVLDNREEQLIIPSDTERFTKILGSFIDSSSRRKVAHKWQISRVKNFDVVEVGPKLIGHYEQAIAKRRKSVDNKIKGPST